MSLSITRADLALSARPVVLIPQSTRWSWPSRTAKPMPRLTGSTAKTRRASSFRMVRRGSWFRLDDGAEKFQLAKSPFGMLVRSRVQLVHHVLGALLNGNPDLFVSAGEKFAGRLVEHDLECKNGERAGQPREVFVAGYLGAGGGP